jgi:hypothetical protein
MGGGVSTPTKAENLEAELMADRAIEQFRPLQIGGKLGQYDPSAQSTNDNYNNNFKPAHPPTRSNFKEAIEEAREHRATALLASGPICPSCARCDNVGQACRICGKIQQATLSSPSKTTIIDKDHHDATNTAILHLIMDAEALKRRTTSDHELYDLAQRRKMPLAAGTAVLDPLQAKELSKSRARALEALSRITARKAALFVDDDKDEEDHAPVLKAGSLLPEIRLVAKTTTSTSIKLAWDVDPAAKTAVNAIKSLSAGKPIMYNLEFRVLKDGGPDKKVRLGSVGLKFKAPALTKDKDKKKGSDTWRY